MYYLSFLLLFLCRRFLVFGLFGLDGLVGWWDGKNNGQTGMVVSSF
jgi:hypothetical protein